MVAQWWDEAVRPRLLLLSLLRRGPRALIATLVVLNLVAGVLPVAFVVASSLLIAQVPGVLADGVGGEAWSSLVASFVAAGAAIGLGAFAVYRFKSSKESSTSVSLTPRTDGGAVVIGGTW